MKNFYDILSKVKYYPPISKKNPRIKKILSLINQLNISHQKILDIGCYDGTLLSLIKPKNNKLYGIETNKYLISKCKNKNILIKNFYVSDKNKLPFDNDFFTLVIAGEIIEHLFDPDHFTKETRRVLANQGYLLISTPNIASFPRRILLLFGFSPYIDISAFPYESSGHIKYFTFKTLEKILKRNGFRILIKKSDTINFSKDGKYNSMLLAKLFPTLGQSVIFLAQKI